MRPLPMPNALVRPLAVVPLIPLGINPPTSSHTPSPSPNSIGVFSVSFAGPCSLLYLQGPNSQVPIDLKGFPWSLSPPNVKWLSTPLLPLTCSGLALQRCNPRKSNRLCPARSDLDFSPQRPRQPHVPVPYRIFITICTQLMLLSHSRCDFYSPPSFFFC